MKKILFIIGILFMTASCCDAQQTAIQATVVDPNGFAYQFLTGSASINCPGNQAPLYNGFSVPRNYPITGGDGNGHLTLVLYDVNVLTPPGCSYNFAITAQNGITNFIAPSIGASGSATPITGTGPVNLSTPINAYAVLLPVTGAGNVNCSISSAVLFETALNTAGCAPTLTYLSPNKKLLVGDPTSSLSGSTPLPPGTWAVQGIHQNTSTSPQDAGVLGVVEADSGVDSVTNRLNGGYFSANSLTNLYSGSGGGILNGVQGIGSASHPAGTAGEVLGGLFTANLNAAGPVTDLSGLAAQAHISGSGLSSIAAAIHTYALVVTGGTPPMGGYGVYINPIFGAVNNWGLWIGNETSDSSHWAVQTGLGKVEFGDTTISDGIIDGQTATLVTTGASATLGAAITASYGSTLSKMIAFNQEGTAGAAVTYTLPTAVAGKTYCVMNSNNGSAPDTGVLTIQTSASGQFIIFTDGTLSATGGFVSSGGAAADNACVVGVDGTHWQLMVQSGTWAKH